MLIYQKKYDSLQKEIRKIPAEKLLLIFGDEMKTNLKDFELNGRMVQENESIKSHRGKIILLLQEIEL
jgi:hypothetical protein